MKKLSYLVNRFFPDFYEYDASKLINFFRVYLEWLEEKDNPYYNIANLKCFTDIDNTVDRFQEYLKNEYMVDIPKEFYANTKYIMHNILKLYQSKGTEHSYKFLFRALYDSFCRISYPRDFILKASDGKWVEGYFLYTADIPKVELSKFISHTIFGKESNAKAVITGVIPYFNENDELIQCFSLVDTFGRFIEGEEIIVIDSEDELKFTLTKSIFTTGYWSNTDGFLNSDKVLQDSYYYQNFSYEITSMVPLSMYKDVVTKIIHPAGLNIFSNVILTDIDKMPIEKTPITFIRWFIIKIFIELMPILIQYDYNFVLHYNVLNSPSNTFTEDYRLYNKLFGAIESFQHLTPFDIENRTDESSTIIFNTNGTRIDKKFIEDTIDELTYYSFSFINDCPVLRLKPENNELVYPWIRKMNIVWVFDPDGNKIRDEYITKTQDTILINYIVKPGLYTIYSIDERFIDAYNKYSLKITPDTILNIVRNKEQVIPFVNGKMVWNKLQNNNTINDEGNLELYQFYPYQDTSIKRFVNTNNDFKYQSKRHIHFV